MSVLASLPSVPTARPSCMLCAAKWLHNCSVTQSTYIRCPGGIHKGRPPAAALDVDARMRSAVSCRVRHRHHQKFELNQTSFTGLPSSLPPQANLENLCFRWRKHHSLRVGESMSRKFGLGHLHITRRPRSRQPGEKQSQSNINLDRLPRPCCSARGHGQSEHEIIRHLDISDMVLMSLSKTYGRLSSPTSHRLDRLHAISRQNTEEKEWVP